ncbi:hypothetical protein GA0070616_2711 [Micromonospora nigra]|uniref:Uncharacterized protein n=1 Tax=Micromonospora nigra TaxID=145857 RepID=A0A1C6S1S6_9ACTN|nr:hypothetical protein GA0070616_2711 [Micromonospora nigra]
MWGEPGHGAYSAFSPFPFGSAAPGPFGNLWIGYIGSIRTSELAGGAMAGSEQEVARQTEDRLGKVAEDVRVRFDEITERFSGAIRNGGFDRVDHGVDRERAGTVRRDQGGSDR